MLIASSMQFLLANAADLKQHRNIITFPIVGHRIHRVFQEFRSLLRDLIPEPILSQKRHTHWVQFTTVQELRVFEEQ